MSVALKESYVKMLIHRVSDPSNSYFLGFKHLHANVQCLPIVYTKKVLDTLEGVESLVQALSKYISKLQRTVILKELDPSPFLRHRRFETRVISAHLRFTLTLILIYLVDITNKMRAPS